MKTKKRILVVDDDIDVLSVVETILVNEGYEVFTALNKVEGLEKARATHPDLAILDVIMETPYEGLELAATLVTAKEFRDMRIMLQTSLRIFEANDDEMMKMARYYRQRNRDREMDVIMVMDYQSGKAGIDYCDASGTSHWLEVDRIIKKPVKAATLIEEIKSILQSEAKNRNYEEIGKHSA